MMIFVQTSKFSKALLKIGVGGLTWTTYLAPKLVHIDVTAEVNKKL